MPPKKSKKLPEFYVLFPDGKRMMFGEIEEIKTISDNEDFYEQQLYITHTQEYEFTARWNPTTKILYFMLHGNFPTNNWLKMHGYRPERKKR